MATKNYTTTTAALKATTADIRVLDAKKVSADSLEVDGVDVMSAIEEAKSAADNAAISVGRDEDKNWGVAENEVTTLVKQINFLGDYVNVVPATDGSGKVQVYIGENKSLNPVKTTLSGAPSTTSYYSFTNDDYTVTGAATKAYHGTKTVGNTNGYTAVTLTANTTASNTPIGGSGTSTTIFTTDSSENKIWFRTTVNGTVGTIASQTLSTDLTNKTLTQDNVTLTTSNKVVTTEHAKDGKIPGQTETSAKFTFDPDTLVPSGGSIKLEWAISKAEPTTWNSTDLFYVEHTATPTASAITASLTSEAYTNKVSGMRYVTSDSTLNVKVAELKNSQNKISSSLNRFQITDTTNKTYTYAIKTDGTMTDGMTETSGDGAKAASAVYALDVDLTTGGSIAASSFTVSGKTWDYNDADNSPSVALTSATINRPYYGTVTDSTDLVESFSSENKRTDNAMVAWGAKSDILFTGEQNIIEGRVPAVVQMGKLYHPSNASIIVDADGNKPSYDGTADAVFYRIIKQSTTSEAGCAAMKVEGSNMTDSNVKMYLTGINADGTLQNKTWIINALSSTSDAIGTGIAAAGKLTGSSIEFDFNTSFESRPPQNKGFLLTIVLGKGAPALGPMTFSIL